MQYKHPESITPHFSHFTPVIIEIPDDVELPITEEDYRGLCRYLASAVAGEEGSPIDESFRSCSDGQVHIRTLHTSTFSKPSHIEQVAIELGLAESDIASERGYRPRFVPVGEFLAHRDHGTLKLVAEDPRQLYSQNWVAEMAIPSCLELSCEINVTYVTYPSQNRIEVIRIDAGERHPWSALPATPGWIHIKVPGGEKFLESNYPVAHFTHRLARFVQGFAGVEALLAEPVLPSLKTARTYGKIMGVPARVAALWVFEEDIEMVNASYVSPSAPLEERIAPELNVDVLDAILDMMGILGGLLSFGEPRSVMRAFSAYTEAQRSRGREMYDAVHGAVGLFVMTNAADRLRARSKAILSYFGRSLSGGDRV